MSCAPLARQPSKNPLLCASEEALAFFNVAVAQLAGEQARKVARAQGNIISLQALPALAHSVQQPLPMEPDEFNMALIHFSDPSSPDYNKAGGLFACVWHDEDDIEQASSLGFLLTRDELGRFGFSIMRAVRDDNGKVAKSLVHYVGHQDDFGKAIGRLVAAACCSPQPGHAVQDQHQFAALPEAYRVS